MKPHKDPARLWARGRWLLIDSHRVMLMRGHQAFNGVSLNQSMTGRERNLFVGRIETAFEDGKRIDEVVTETTTGERFTVCVIPLRDPVDGAVTAVHACCVQEGRELPPRPMAGAWQWQVQDDGAGRLTATAIWSPEVFTLFGMDVPPATDQHYPHGNRIAGSKFTQRLVSAPFSSVLHDVLREGRNAPDARLIHRTYSGRTAEDTELHLRMLCRRVYDDPFALSGPGRSVARGCTIELAELTTAPPAAEPISAALLSLSRDPIALVNATYGAIYQTNGRFDGLGLEIPPSYHVREMCHPDDVVILDDLVEKSTSSPNTEIGPVVVRFAVGGGGYRPLVLSARAVPWQEVTVLVCRLLVAD